MVKLILIRHGQSLWNAENKFTGWADSALSSKGKIEAKQAGIFLKNNNIEVCFTSMLTRAINTLEILLKELENNAIKTIKAWELNERHYGSLQGLNKKETAEKYGAEQVHIWRRSFDVPPPDGESLKMNAERTIPYFKENVIEDLKKGKNVLVSAHGNSLRSIVMYIENISKEDVVKLEIQTGVPRTYLFENNNFTRIND